MSRIGKVPVAIPSGVTAAIENGVLSVKGPKGNLTLGMREEISYAVDGDTIVIKPANATKAARASPSESTPRGVDRIEIPRPL